MEELNDYLASLESSLKWEKKRWKDYLEQENEERAVWSARAIAMIVREISKVERSMGFN